MVLKPDLTVTRKMRFELDMRISTDNSVSVLSI